MLMVLASAAELALKPDDNSWVASGFIMVFWLLFFLMLVWAILFIAKKRLPVQLVSRWFSTVNSEETKGLEILYMSSLSPRTKAYRIRLSSQEFLVIDNQQSVVIQPLVSDMQSEETKEQ